MKNKKIKYDTSTLYLAKCRHCIMDIVNTYSTDGEDIIPRPDYINYYTIIIKKDDKYINVFHPSIPLIQSKNCKNLEENYGSDIIFTLQPLSQYIKEYDKLNYRECLISLEIISRIYNLNDSYGYKHQRSKKKLPK